MILVDSDVRICLLRQYPPVMRLFDTFDDEEEELLLHRVSCGGTNSSPETRQSKRKRSVSWLPTR